MSDTEADAVPPSQILKKLSKETLEKLYLREKNEDSEAEKISKKKMIEAVSKVIDDTGIDCTLNLMKREDLKAVADSLKLTFEKQDNKNSKAVITKKIKETIQETTIDEFLSKKADKELLERLCSCLDIEPESKDKNKLAEQVSDKMRENGAQMYWNSCDVDLLHSVTTDLKFKTAKGTNSKRKLVEALLTDSAPEKDTRKKKKRKTEYSDEKPAIEKGITYDDMFQHYSSVEIREYCKKHGMKASGKKKPMIERILNYLEGDDEDEKKSSKDKKKSSEKD